MSNPQALMAQLKIIPPDSKLKLGWQDHSSNEETQTEGRLVDYNPRSAARRIETDTRTLLLTPAVDESELTVCEVTPTQTRSLGTLTSLSVIEHAVETIEITPDGVDVPSYLVGYSGFLVVETPHTSHECRIPEPGLKAYDDRLVGYCEGTSAIQIRPQAGPHRKYEVLDTRLQGDSAETQTHPPTQKQPQPPVGNYDGLDELSNTIAALAKTIERDDELTETTRTDAQRRLHETQRWVLRARRDIINADAETDEHKNTTSDSGTNEDTSWQPTPEYAADISESQTPDNDQSTTGSEYRPTLEYLTETLDRLEATAQQEPKRDDSTFVHSSFRQATNTVEELYGLLCSSDRSVPAREDTAGRGDGDGRWLECQLRNAFQRWGYSASMRRHVFGVEVDVIGVRRHKQDDPTDWLLAQCKDWDQRVITPRVIFRLCMLAFTCRAMPVLCHTTSLTDRAREIADRWEVRVLELDDLHRGSLPAPHTLGLSNDLCGYPTTYTSRDERGSLPVELLVEANKQFTYVPGYEPVGHSHEYRPVEREDSSEATSASGSEQ